MTVLTRSSTADVHVGNAQALLDQFKEAVITIEQHSCFEFAPMPMTPMHQGNDGSAPCAYSLSALVA